MRHGCGGRYPLFGYHKKWYIIISSVFGVGAFVGLAALPIDSANVAALFIFLANIQVGGKIVKEAQGEGSRCGRRGGLQDCAPETRCCCSVKKGLRSRR
jgi:hypothetical protein